MSNPSKSALILIEYVNDWLAPTGGINGQFQDREQVDTAIANSKIMLEEARRAYDEGSRTLKLGEESKNSPKYLERMARLKDGVTTHENNIQAVRRELSNLK